MNLEEEQIKVLERMIVENSDKIRTLCKRMKDNMDIASQCMDSVSGKGMAGKIVILMNYISNNLPLAEDSEKRLAKTLKLIYSARDDFGGKSR
ncbi:MAG: hypothetical protein ACI4JS_06485 [Oscillospiraceae bacterium]